MFLHWGGACRSREEEMGRGRGRGGWRDIWTGTNSEQASRTGNCPLPPMFCGPLTPVANLAPTKQRAPRLFPWLPRGGAFTSPSPRLHPRHLCPAPNGVSSVSPSSTVPSLLARLQSPPVHSATHPSYDTVAGYAHARVRSPANSFRTAPRFVTESSGGCSLYNLRLGFCARRGR